MGILMKLALRLVTILAVAVGALVATASPAAAISLCGVLPVPAPVKSGNAVSWTGGADCAFPANIHVRTNLYKIVGSGDNQSYQWVDFSDRTQITTVLWAPKSRSCNGTTSTRYIVNVYAYANGGAINGSPRWSSVATLACGA